jgi:anti-sigma regulatory factor (Ser/Thr protein kinase)
VRRPLRTLPRVRGPGAGETLQPGADITGTQRWPLRTYLELAALPTAVPCARLHTKNVLHEWHLGFLAGTAELLVSELVTNAAHAAARTGQHPGPGVPTVKLWLTSDGQRVLIQVWDHDHHRPARQDTDLDAESGRGLLLVQTLSAEWGSYIPDDRDGKIVWALCVGDDARVS